MVVLLTWRRNVRNLKPDFAKFVLVRGEEESFEKLIKFTCILHFTSLFLFSKTQSCKNFASTFNCHRSCLYTTQIRPLTNIAVLKVINLYIKNPSVNQLCSRTWSILNVLVVWCVLLCYEALTVSGQNHYFYGLLPLH